MNEETYFDLFDSGVFDGYSENGKMQFQKKKNQEVYDIGYVSGVENKRIRDEYFDKYVIK